MDSDGGICGVHMCMGDTDICTACLGEHVWGGLCMCVGHMCTVPGGDSVEGVQGVCTRVACVCMQGCALQGACRVRACVRPPAPHVYTCKCRQ